MLSSTLGCSAERAAVDRSLQIAHNCLVRAIRHAESNDLVGRNVAALIRPPAGHEGRPSKALSVDQAQALLRAAADERPDGSPHRLHAYVIGVPVAKLEGGQGVHRVLGLLD